MTTALSIKALRNECLNFVSTEVIILHSYLDSQHTGNAFESFLASKGIVDSFSRKGNPYDNASIGSFHSILKKEEVNHHKYYDFNIARKVIFEYIKSWYNLKNIHSFIDYMITRAVNEFVSVT